MYYEEQWIDGELCWRSSPDGTWTAYTAYELGHRYQGELKRARDAQATVEALQAIIKQMGEQACVLAKDGMAAKVQVEALQRERDHAKNMAAVQKEVADNQTWHVRELTAALDAEREKVKGLHEATKVICGHCCEPMEIPSKAVLQTQLSQLQALVRALVCTMGYVVDGSYILTRGGVVLYACSSSISAERLGAVLAYRATLPATPTERGQG